MTTYQGGITRWRPAIGTRFSTYLLTILPGFWFTCENIIKWWDTHTLAYVGGLDAAKTFATCSACMPKYWSGLPRGIGSYETSSTDTLPRGSTG